MAIERKGKKRCQRLQYVMMTKRASYGLKENDFIQPVSQKRSDCYESGEKLVESDQNYDILFLDIDMDGMNGIETAKVLREKDKNVKIIYVTSYAEYVHYAFAVHAFAYLLKPVSQEQVKSTAAGGDFLLSEEEKRR